jgi:hypothetical protein
MWFEMSGNENKRIFVDAYGKTKENLEYTEQIKRLSALGKEIAELLGANRNLIEKYENTFYLAEGIYLEHTYRIGNEDGYKLAKGTL